MIEIYRPDPTSFASAGSSPAQFTNASRSPDNRRSVRIRYNLGFHCFLRFFQEQSANGSFVGSRYEDLH